MAFTAKIYRNATDTFDISLGLRVAPDEPFDPFDADIIEPQFSDSAITEGADLLSTHYGNREMVFPVHLSASKYGYADTKDGLNGLLTRVGFMVKNAWRVEWADDSATNSTWFDVVSARFEPEANFRRQQRNWVTGIIRVWVRPFGHTGTARIWQTVGGSLPYFNFPSVSRIGDADTEVDVTLSIGNMSGAFANLGLVAGFGVRKVKNGGFVSAPTLFVRATQTSLLTPASMILVGDSTSAGSQAVRLFNSGLAGNAISFDFFYPRNELELGRNRVFLAFNRGASSVLPVSSWGPQHVSALDSSYQSGIAMGPTQVAATVFADRWEVVDCGIIFNGTHAMETATHSTIGVTINFPSAASIAQASRSLFVDVAGVITVPDDTTLVAVDNVTSVGSQVATYVFSITEKFYARAGAGSAAIRNVDHIDSYLRGVHPKLPVAPTSAVDGVDSEYAFAFAWEIWGLNINNNVSSTVRVRERFTYQR